MEQPAPPGRPRKAPTPGSWRPGQSGNPKGRPRKGNALTESIQAGCDPDELRDIALDLARHATAESTRIAALNWLRDSGYTRPAERHELALGAPSDDDEPDLSGLSVDQLRRLHALDDERDAILASTDAAPADALPAASGASPAPSSSDPEQSRDLASPVAPVRLLLDRDSEGLDD